MSLPVVTHDPDLATLEQIQESFTSPATHAAYIANMGPAGMAFANFLTTKQVLDVVRVFSIQPAAQLKALDRKVRGQGKFLYSIRLVETALMTAFSFARTSREHR